MPETVPKRRPIKPLSRGQIAELLGRRPEEISSFKARGKLSSYLPKDVGRFIFGEIREFMESGLKKRYARNMDGEEGK